MKLIELKTLVDFYCDNERFHDVEVVIPNGKSSLGPTSATKVQFVHTGHDWDSGKFLIVPETPMTERGQTTQTTFPSASSDIDNTTS